MGEIVAEHIKKLVLVKEASITEEHKHPMQKF